MTSSITELMNMIDESKDQMPEGVYLKIVNQLAEVYKNQTEVNTTHTFRRQQLVNNALREELERVSDIASEQDETIQQMMEICRNKNRELESTKRKLVTLTNLSKSQSSQIKEYSKELEIERETNYKLQSKIIKRIENELSDSDSEEEEKGPSGQKELKLKFKKRQTIIRRHKTLEKLWHRESGMVFKSATERVVIGKVKNIDVIAPLEPLDIETCTEYHFRIAE